MQLMRHEIAYGFFERSTFRFMVMAMCNNAFSRSRSDPSIQHTVDKPCITRTLSHPSGQPKPTLIDFQIPNILNHNQAPTIFNSCQLMKQDDQPKVASRTTFKIFDPLRVVDDFSRPPKRYYRTFWQSTARRLVRRCSKWDMRLLTAFLWCFERILYCVALSQYLTRAGDWD